jgi:hypothetical protein
MRQMRGDAAYQVSWLHHVNAYTMVLLTTTPLIDPAVCVVTVDR